MQMILDRAPAVAKPRQKEWIEQFLKDHMALFYRVAASYEAEPARREDLLQEIVLAVWQGARRFEGRSSFRTFAFRIAHNRAISHVAREVRRREREVPDTVVAATAAAASDAGELIDQERLLAAVRALPVSLRQVATMALEGLTYEEIAAVLDITPNNVGVRLNRARAKLKKRLADD